MKLIKTTENGVMKFATMDAITSKKIADALGVKHRDLLLNVKKVEKYEKSQVRDDTPDFHPKFIDYTYESRGRVYDCKLINEDGIKALIKVIDTQEAYNYFAILMSEFNKMRRERISRDNVKIDHVNLTDQCQILYEGLKDEGSKMPHEARFHTIIGKKTKKAVSGSAKTGSDALENYQNDNLLMIERDIAYEIKVLKSGGKHSAYEIKDSVYKLINKYQKLLAREDVKKMFKRMYEVA